MQSTLARPGPARPVTVLIVLLALDAGGAMAQDRWDRIDCYGSDCVNDRCNSGSCYRTDYSSSTDSCTCGTQPSVNNVGRCCDPDAGSSLGPPTIVTCAEYPEGRVGPLWDGRIVCLSHKQGGYPKTAAGVLYMCSPAPHREWR